MNQSLHLAHPLTSSLSYIARKAYRPKRATNEDKSPDVIETEIEPSSTGDIVGGPSIPRSALVYSPGGQGSFAVEVKSTVKYWPLICPERVDKTTKKNHSLDTKADDLAFCRSPPETIHSRLTTHCPLTTFSTQPLPAVAFKAQQVPLKVWVSTIVSQFTAEAEDKG